MFSGPNNSNNKKKDIVSIHESYKYYRDTSRDAKIPEELAKPRGPSSTYLHDD